MQVPGGKGNKQTRTEQLWDSDGRYNSDNGRASNPLMKWIQLTRGRAEQSVSERGTDVREVQREKNCSGPSNRHEAPQARLASGARAWNPEPTVDWPRPNPEVDQV